MEDAPHPATWMVLLKVSVESTTGWLRGEKNRNNNKPNPKKKMEPGEGCLPLRVALFSLRWVSCGCSLPNKVRGGEGQTLPHPPSAGGLIEAKLPRALSLHPLLSDESSGRNCRLQRCAIPQTCAAVRRLRSTSLCSKGTNRHPPTHLALHRFAHSVARD
jgi:hypothetical protein